MTPLETFLVSMACFVFLRYIIGFLNERSYKKQVAELMKEIEKEGLK